MCVVDEGGVNKHKNSGRVQRSLLLLYEALGYLKHLCIETPTRYAIIQLSWIPVGFAIEYTRLPHAVKLACPQGLAAWVTAFFRFPDIHVGVVAGQEDFGHLKIFSFYFQYFRPRVDFVARDPTLLQTFKLPQHPFYLPCSGINNCHGRHLAAGQNVGANRYLLGLKRFNSAGINPLVSSAHNNHIFVLKKFFCVSIGQRLPPSRSNQNFWFCASTTIYRSTYLLNGFYDRLGTQDHPRAAAVGPLIHLTPFIARRVAQLICFDLQKLFPLRATQNRRLRVSVYYLRKQSYYVKIQNYKLPKSPIASSMLFIAGVAGTSCVPSQPWAAAPPEGPAPSMRPPAGSLIFRLTRALCFIPTTRKSVRIALAVLPERPITLPMSSALRSSVKSTPISSTTRVILTSSGCSTSPLMTNSKNSWSLSLSAIAVYVIC